MNVLLFLLAFTASQAQVTDAPKPGEIKIHTSAICEMCKEAIEYELTFTKGVKSAELDLDTKEVTIHFNPKKIDPSALRKAIAGVGYHADDVKRDPEAYAKLPFCCKDNSPHLNRKKTGGH